MGDFLRVLLDSIEYLWPFRIVHTYERGGYYVLGHYWREMGPGLKVVVPFFTSLTTATTVPALVGTGREDITLKDGTFLSFSAMATVRVVDVTRALNAVDQYHDAVRELIGSYLAERLANMTPEKFEPEKRSATLRQLRDGVAAEASEFGVEVTKLRFTSFVLKARTYRLLMDQDRITPW